MTKIIKLITYDLAILIIDDTKFDSSYDHSKFGHDTCLMSTGYGMPICG